MINYLGTNTVIPVNNLDRAIKFYTEILGLRVEDYDVANGMYWLVLGSQKIVIYNSETPITSSHTGLRLTVENLIETVDYLESKGISTPRYNELKYVNFSNHRSMWISDTEGNYIEFSEHFKSTN